jgi:hypothetical protein
MLTNVSSSIFTESESITLTPVVSAEWNQNIFNPPSYTVAGNAKNTVAVTAGSGITSSTKTYQGLSALKKEINSNNSVATASFSLVPDSTPDFPTNGYKAFKIVTYVTTDLDKPVLVNISANGTENQFGSSSEEINSFSWTKIETYVGSQSAIDSLTYRMTYSPIGDASQSSQSYLYFTTPQVYETSYFDYQYGTTWPTDVVFSSFRPGESYVCTGNAGYALGTGGAPFADNYRKVNNTSILQGYSSPFKMPVSPIVSTPNFFALSSDAPIYKSALLTDISSYKYYVSGQNVDNSVSAIYNIPIIMNKIVLKFNTFLSSPSVTVTVTKSDNSTISFQGAPNSTGVLIVYLDGNSLTTSRWPQASMPTIGTNGSITSYVYIKKITVTQNSATVLPEFDLDNPYVSQDADSMQLIEVSPRLEIDLSDFVLETSTNKSLDGKDTVMPISSLVTDDANISFSGMPLGDINSPVPVFSDISNYTSTQLKGMFKKNVKFYINYNLKSYANWSSGGETVSNTIIPGGVYYSDSWQQDDIDRVSVQCYDITRYLQNVPASDYVSHFKTAFETITNILDLSGFTDYDVDSLYAACMDSHTPLSISYYYCNSKDTTLAEALNQIFLPYQIAAYIDNFGVMKFMSLSNILGKASATQDFSLDDSDILNGGYSVSTKAKPGKISLRYTTPRIKQSLSLQNVIDPQIKNGPSYIYTTSNDVVWEQQSIDSLGLNYLVEDMSETDHQFTLHKSDLLDIFHTFNLSTNGYAAIENEIVSFVYKKYKISKTSDSATYSEISVKNDIELGAAINQFIKEKRIGLVENVGIISGVSQSESGGQNFATYSFSSTPTADVKNPLTTVKVGDLVSIRGMKPEALNGSYVVQNVTSNSFTVISPTSDTMQSGWTSGRFEKATSYDITIEPLGTITNIQRGMFGTSAAKHEVISGDFSTGVNTKKDLYAKDHNGTTLSTSNNASVVTTQNSDPYYYIQVEPGATGRTLIYSGSASDSVYNSYSGKFFMPIESNRPVELCSGGIFFNMYESNLADTYFLELVRYNPPQTAAADYMYALIFSKQDAYSGDLSPIAYANVSGVVNSIMSNFEKIWVKNPSPTKKDGSDAYILYVDPHEAFNLRIAMEEFDYHESGEGSADNPTGHTFTAFLNNFEISGWQVYENDAWKSTDVNTVNGLRKKVALLEYAKGTDTKFGVFLSNAPTVLPSSYIDGEWKEPLHYPETSSNGLIGYVREIYASEKILKNRSVNYYFQDPEFLNGLVQGHNLASNYDEFIMQTQPCVTGINVYDVQYTNGSAVSVDVLPVEYAWYYFPGNTLLDQKYLQRQVVDEYSVAYSTPVNTGFRGKFAVANNSSHMVYLKKDSDDINQFAVNFNLWTHEIIVPSDPEIIEVVTNPGNMQEVVQLDSEFIQSKQDANKLLKLVSTSLENFSKDVSLNIFGNPLIEVGDVVKLTYPVAGVNQQKYVVHSVNNSFNNGLQTQISLKMLDAGISV